MTIKNHPITSIIIPTYNRLHVLPRAVESVLNQTLKDYEIIVVDDASTDNTKKMLIEKYGVKIIYIGKRRNEGLSAARNTGIKSSRGKYIAFLDDDDVWLPKKLELQIDLIEKNPSLGLVYCGCYKVDRDDKVMSEIKPTKKGYIFDDMLCANYIVGSASAALVKRELLVNTGYFDENLTSLEDWDLWIRISKFHEIDYVDQPLVKYKMHDYNMSKNILNMEKSTFSVFNKYWPELSKDKKYEEKKNKLYSDHCISFAWRYYHMGERDDFERLLFLALEYYPLNRIYIRGEDLQGKEKAVFSMFDKYWNQCVDHKLIDGRKKAYTSQYIQLAGEYYNHREMHNYRRCLAGAFRCSFPRVPLRLSIPFIKSFLGKTLADRIHNVRKRLMKCREL